MTRQVEIIGHRGARGLFPENTLEGFHATHALGVRAFELDVGLTRDGVAVVHHDLALNPALARDGAGHWIPEPGTPIHHLTFARIQTFDVGRILPGSLYRLRHRHQAAIDGARIPALEAVLRQFPDTRFIVELKTDPRFPEQTACPIRIAEAALAAVDAAGAADRVIFESFDWRGPRHIRRLRPALPMAWLTRDETVRDAALWWDGARVEDAGSVPAAVLAQGGQIWAPAWETLRRADIDLAHRLGLRVIPWTVNQIRPMRRLIAWGVDGLITDRPDRAAAVQSAML